jgi:hypothetical protein
MEAIVDSFRLLSNEQLLAEVPIFVARERSATAVLVAALAEVKVRQLFLARGFSSMHSYCAEELHMSNGAAYRRIAAARIAQHFPVTLDYLADGSLSLTTLTVLGPSLTVDNHRTLIDAARHKTRRQVEQQVAALRPNAPDLIPLRIRVSRETHDKLLRAQELLRHVVPDGDVAEIFDRALTSLIAGIEKKKLAQVARPRRGRALKMGSRTIPAAVRRAVVQRDGGRCTFVGEQGRCAETGFLEFHHIKPFAKGGAPTVENIQLRCRAHNQYEADKEFGPSSSIVRERPPVHGGHGGESPRISDDWQGCRLVSWGVTETAPGRSSRRRSAPAARPALEPGAASTLRSRPPGARESRRARTAGPPAAAT